jgi:hypothetical protein
VRQEKDVEGALQ